ncbi:hypothetical protein QK908_10085 [Lactococcus cremoris]
MTVLLFDIDNTLLDFDKAELMLWGKFLPIIKLKIIKNRATYSRENKALAPT